MFKAQDNSLDHNTHMATWKAFEVRLAMGLTIDKKEIRKRWHSFRLRETGNVKFLLDWWQ